MIFQNGGICQTFKITGGLFQLALSPGFTIGQIVTIVFLYLPEGHREDGTYRCVIEVITRKPVGLEDLPIYKV